MAVWPPVNHAYSAMGGMTKDQDRRAGHVEFGHRLTDREAFQSRGRFGNDYRRETLDGIVVLRRLDDIGCRAAGRCRVAPLVPMLLEPAMVAAGPVFAA